MFCKYCGDEITDDTVFCPKCGNRVKKENTNPDSAGENVVNENEAADKQECSVREDVSDSDSFAKDAAASDNAANEQGSEAAKETVNNTPGETAKEIVDSVSSDIESTNPLCIAGLVLTVVMFFFNYYCIVGFAAFIISLLGYKAAKEEGQKGMALAIICMVVSGIASLVFIGYFIEYKRYESAVYGVFRGLFDLLGDL